MRPTLNSTVSPKQPLAAFELDGDAARLRLADVDDAFAEPEDHAQRAGVMEQCFDDFAIAEFEQLCAAVDDGDLHAQRGEHDGVFEADHAAADDDHRPRNACRAHRTSSESKIVSPLNGIWPGRDGPCAGRQQDVLGLRGFAFRRGRQLRRNVDRRTTPRRKRR